MYQLNKNSGKIFHDLFFMTYITGNPAMTTMMTKRGEKLITAILMDHLTVFLENWTSLEIC